jgi:hypothetical protein
MAAYAARIKPGDVVKTPDDALWIVDRCLFEEYEVTSAELGADGNIYRCCPEVQVRTLLPTEFVVKVADARDAAGA